jgi:hypothetical protein
MEERCRRLTPPESLQTLTPYPWSGTYTSAIDSIWPQVLRNSWRDLQPAFEESYSPRDFRGKTTLHCTFLFGCVNRTEAGFRPSLKEAEWGQQKQVALECPAFLTSIYERDFVL